MQSIVVGAGVERLAGGNRLTAHVVATAVSPGEGNSGLRGHCSSRRPEQQSEQGTGKDSQKNNAQDGPRQRCSQAGSYRLAVLQQVAFPCQPANAMRS